MDKGTESLIREDIIDIFPKLSEDPHFLITSPSTNKYNCIAWAHGYSDRWMEPIDQSLVSLHLDIIFYWPDDVECANDIRYLMRSFELKDYELCDSWEHEEGFQKVALYIDLNSSNYTHAAREIVADKKRCGKWTSKLGQGYDIQHGNPYTIEGDIYGRVYCIMKRKFP